MSFSSILTAAEKWVASLFSTAGEIESAVETVKADPVLSTAVTGAKDVVEAELSKAGVPAEKIEATGAAILHGLSGVAAAVPTVLADAKAIESDFEQAKPATGGGDGSGAKAVS